MSRGDFERMTIERLCEWANGLGLCEFEVADDVAFGKVARAKCDKKVSMELHLSRYSEDAMFHGGRMHASVYWQDRRKGYEGGGNGDVTLDGFESMLRATAKRLGIGSGQMRLF